MSEPLQYGTGNDWWLVHTDPISGAQTYIQDMGDGNTAIRTVTPVNKILDSAATDRANNSGKGWGDGQVIGTVPMSLYFATGYADAKKNGDTPWIKRWWNDSDHKYLRTKEGTI